MSSESSLFVYDTSNSYNYFYSVFFLSLTIYQVFTSSARVFLDAFFTPTKAWKHSLSVKLLHYVQFVACILQFISQLLAFLNYRLDFASSMFSTAHLFLVASIAFSLYTAQRNLNDTNVVYSLVQLIVLIIPMGILIIIVWTVNLSNDALDLMTSIPTMVYCGVYISSIYFNILKLEKILSKASQ